MNKSKEEIGNILFVLAIVIFIILFWFIIIPS
jgi:hypothetical protein